MKKQKKESAKSFINKDGRFGLITTPLNAKQRKDREPTGQIFMPNTIPKVMRDQHEQLMKSFKLGKNYKDAAVELLWKYKAQKVIIQNLLKALTMAECKISGNATAPLSFTSSFSEVAKALSTSAPGPMTTSAKNYIYDGFGLTT